jgi:glycosyltransferase involved in cell wall biosynthesis
MKIAQIAPVWARVPPEKYGGVELVVHNITEELIKRGHEVTLFASGDSKTKARLVSVVKKNLFAQHIPWEEHAYLMLNLNKAFSMAQKFDVIHCHEDYWPFYSGIIKTPVVYTIHSPTTDITPARKKVLTYFKDVNWVCISEAQHNLSEVELKKTAVVYNGIELKKHVLTQQTKDYFVWLGRFDRIKGGKEAILAAKKAKEKLVLAGHIGDQKYFEKEIKPLIDGKQIKYIGEIEHQKVSEFVSGAKGFLDPLMWDEPFGLVMVEAQASGTPVIAFDRGSAREVVKDGETGFIVDFNDIEAMVGAMKKIQNIDRSRCRKYVKDNFSIEKMVDGYERVYQRIISEAK